MAFYDEWLDRTLRQASTWPLVGEMAERVLDRRGAFSEPSTDRYVPERIPTEDDFIKVIQRGEWIKLDGQEQRHLVGKDDEGYRSGKDHRFNLGIWPHQHTTWLPTRFSTEQEAVDYTNELKDVDRYVAKHGGKWSVELVDAYYDEKFAVNRSDASEDGVGILSRSDWLTVGDSTRRYVIGQDESSHYRVGQEHQVDYHYGSGPSTYISWFEEKYESRDAANEYAARGENLDRYIVRHGGDWSMGVVQDFYDQELYKWRQSDPKTAIFVGPPQMVGEELLNPGSRVEADNALRAAKCTDWWADFSDDGDVRRAGAQQIYDTRTLFEKLASRGDAEAHLASTMWDSAAPHEFNAFRGYISPERRYMQFEDVTNKIEQKAEDARTYWRDLGEAAPAHAANNNDRPVLRV